MAEKIVDKDSVAMYESDYSKYAMVVDRRRMIADTRDGLLPVQRRVLYTLFDLGLIDKNNDKSAQITGITMGKYHPHSLDAVYGAAVNMAVWFKSKYPLCRPDGNFGSVMGEPPGAQRYTHFSLSKFGYDVMIDDISKSRNVVDWIETYKRKKDMEPDYLPAKLPMILVNGAFGIGVGFVIRVPSHNIVEVINVIKGLLQDPNYQFTLIPDLCQECELIATKKDWEEINKYGAGCFKVRGKIVTEQDNKGNYTLRITSLPDDVTTTSVYDKILSLIEDKQLPMIKDIFNSLEDKKPNIIIELKAGANPEYVKQVIYSKTDTQKTFNVNFEAVTMNGLDIKRFSYREYLLNFIDMRMTTKFRLYCNMLQQYMTRHHRIDAYIKVMQSGEIDNIIAMIKKSTKNEEGPIIEYIIKHCHVTDIQAKFIIDINLSRLNKAYLNNLIAERKELDAKIKEYEAKVTDDGSLIKQDIAKELDDIVSKYGDKRLCKTVKSDNSADIPAGMFKIVITEKNFVRKLIATDKVNIIKKDNPKFIITIDNREELLLFDNKGKVYNIPVYKIPVTDKSYQGTDVRFLIRNLTADIAQVIPVNKIKAITESNIKCYMVILTKSNLIKKMDLEDFLSVNQSGLLYTKIRDSSDEVVSVKLVPAGLDVVVSAGKKVLRFSSKDIPLIKRSTFGVKAIDTTENVNSMVEMFNESTDIVVVTKSGKFNRFKSTMLTPHARGSKGAGVIKLDGNDEIFSILGCREQDSVRIVTLENIYDIKVADIKEKSPIASGTKMIPSNQLIVRAEVLY